MFIQLFLITCLVGYQTFAAHSNSHVVIYGTLSNDEKLKIESLLNASHISNALLNKSIHYLRSPLSKEELKSFFSSMDDIPNIQGIDYQSEIYVRKMAPLYTLSSRPRKRTALANDLDYAFAVLTKVNALRKALNFNDPYAREMWQFLNDGSPRFGGFPGFDINSYPLYAANITGKGSVVIVVDDALDTTHEDLRPNIDVKLTDDLLNSTRKDARGTDFFMKKSDGHGTEVAGLVAAVANNSKCAFGVSYGATLGGIRLLGHKVTDFMVGEALVRFSKQANVYVSSWGPSDDGKTMRSPRKFMNEALASTTHQLDFMAVAMSILVSHEDAYRYNIGPPNTHERFLSVGGVPAPNLHSLVHGSMSCREIGNHGRGSVFLFPSGNGGDDGDNCGADGFVNHPQVISVSAMSEDGLMPVYAERCAAVSIAVPIGGAPDRKTFQQKMMKRKFIVPTTSINNHCTEDFVGTSASNPIVAGVISLAIEVNPLLKPRDINALIALSGRIPVAAAYDWSINGGGLLVSHTYGAGLLNAVHMVNLARNWKPIGPQTSCVLRLGEARNSTEVKRKTKEKRKYLAAIYPGKTSSFNFTFTEDQCSVSILEMVRVEMQWNHRIRGALDVWLRSPSGQAANLLAPRRRDKFNGDSEMIWKSLIHTGESCLGNWTVSVRDDGRRGRFGDTKRPRGFIYLLGIQALGTVEGESALERNADAILSHWTKAQKWARKHRQAVRLSKAWVHKIYDWQRWDALNEEVIVA